MSATQLELGDVVTARFPVHNPHGHEQEGYRPAVVVGLPERLGPPRFKTVLVAPLTTDRGGAWSKSALYPRLAAGVGGLPDNSLVLLEQTRALGTDRMVRYLGQLTEAQYGPVKRCFAHICAFVAEPGPA